MTVRAARPEEVDLLAQLWFDGWRDAHAAIVPAALARLRTLESFRERMAAALAETRVVGGSGPPLGFSMVRGAELYQLYVAAAARGTGAAALLIADAEARIADAGFAVAWLACAIGNDRAARFYEKCGWRRAGVVVTDADTSSGPFPLEVWRYEKRVGRRSPGARACCGGAGRLE
jgi:GNAT superfamily N-acetyltransferase